VTLLAISNRQLDFKTFNLETKSHKD